MTGTVDADTDGLDRYRGPRTPFLGGWGFFQKLATNSMPPKSVYLLTESGAFISAFLILVSLHFRVQVTPKGMGFALFTMLFLAG